MEIFFIRLLQFMLAISLLVLLHEGGHFFFSKLFGVRVEKFYLFFDPWFHLFEWKPKNSETAYGVGWLPLGGYCKIAGMIDESFDTYYKEPDLSKLSFDEKAAITVEGEAFSFDLADIKSCTIKPVYDFSGASGKQSAQRPVRGTT